MQDELLLKRTFLRHEISMLIMCFMKESDKEEARKIIAAIQDRTKKLEEINCKLALIEFQKKFKGKGESK